MTEPLTQIIYRSISVGHPTELDLHPILVTAREFNTAHDISGMLLYRQRVFLQILEGPSDEVANLYARIQLDERHRNVETLVDAAIEQRRFARWAMAFRVFDRLGSLPLRGLSPALEQRDIELIGLDAAAAECLFDDLSRSL